MRYGALGKNISQSMHPKIILKEDAFACRTCHSSVELMIKGRNPKNRSYKINKRLVELKSVTRTRLKARHNAISKKISCGIISLVIFIHWFKST